MSTEKVMSIESLIVDADKWIALTKNLAVNVDASRSVDMGKSTSDLLLDDYFHQRERFDQDTRMPRGDLVAAFMSS